MSSRHLRRVKEQLQHDPATVGKVEEEEDEEEEGEEDTSASAKPFNPFDLLSDDDEVGLSMGKGRGSIMNPSLEASDEPCMTHHSCNPAYCSGSGHI